MNQPNGFTSIEVLIAFFIFLVIASILPQFFRIITFEPKLLHRMETSTFFQQLTFDVHQAATILVDNNILYLQKSNDETVTYAYHQQRIRRQVNNKGQEIVMQNIVDVNFVQWSNGIDITVTDIFNNTHNRRVTHLLPLERMYVEE
ncbi:hypothetical protein BKP37_15970 [Anaerobacillus alkalilacustris]|uniref:Competence protein ComGF n=1 Tax=Anaerobacillus alkalilacustris TaxID=393763 RepID=A0A1S2LG08_9BACI|nr:competence type IV pilus minor pilin ComGF [Anaerobacillus alkalilacustris]OIJ11306.1 hypothetical protein BKP37_15970 [Anaerobacillus alkalilacustris]